jgi:hypothetical protein
MPKSVTTINAHVRKNKTTYITGAACLILGFTMGGLALKSNTLVKIQPIQVLTWKSKQTIEVFIEALGDPGNIIQDTTTGIIYASQGQAARELGINPSLISQHLRGKFPTAKGHSFIKLGKAAVPETLA